MRIFHHSQATAPSYPPLVRLYDVPVSWNAPSPSVVYDPATGAFQAVTAPSINPVATNPRAGRYIQHGPKSHQRTIWG